MTIAAELDVVFDGVDGLGIEPSVNAAAMRCAEVIMCDNDRIMTDRGPMNIYQLASLIATEILGEIRRDA